MSTAYAVSYCAECDLRLLEEFPWCHNCGGPTEPRELQFDEGVAYATTTTHMGAQQRTLVFVDIDHDLRILAEAPRPVAIGERGRLSISQVVDGTSHFAFHPADNRTGVSH